MARATRTFSGETDAPQVSSAQRPVVEPAAEATRQFHHFLRALARDAARADHLAAVAARKA